MENTLNLTLEPELKLRLENESKLRNINPADLIKHILRDYLYMEKLDSTRKKYQDRFEKMGFKNEDDIFIAVS